MFCTSFINSLILADVQLVDLPKSTEAAPEVDQAKQKQLQENIKQSTEGADFCIKKISESQKFLAVST